MYTRACTQEHTSQTDTHSHHKRTHTPTPTHLLHTASLRRSKSTFLSPFVSSPLSASAFLSSGTVNLSGSSILIEHVSCAPNLVAVLAGDQYRMCAAGKRLCHRQFHVRAITHLYNPPDFTFGLYYSSVSKHTQTNTQRSTHKHAHAHSHAHACARACTPEHTHKISHTDHRHSHHTRTHTHIHTHTHTTHVHAPTPTPKLHVYCFLETINRCFFVLIRI